MSSQGFVSYYRVSTDRQGKSGLGLEAQVAAVQSFIAAQGGKLVASFTEVESGKHNDRIELTKALAECRLRNATLVIAKLDRLSRNAAFLMNLNDSGARFITVDNPTMNHLTVGVQAVVAQHEALMISRRTKDALEARRARGLPLGNPSNLSEMAAAKGRLMGVVAKEKLVAARTADLTTVFQSIQISGHRSLTAIAKELNTRGFNTVRGGSWTAVQVSRVLQRIQRTC